MPGMGGAASAWRKGAVVLASIAIAAGSVAGCAGRSAAGPVLVRIGAPVSDPTWSGPDGDLVAIATDHRLASITVSGTSAHTRLTAPLGDAGKNVATSDSSSIAYLPQPDRGRVAVVSLDTMRVTDTLRVGPRPSTVALAPHASVLLALSADGATVSGIDLHTHRTRTERVNAGPNAEIDASDRDRRVEFHVVGPHGVALYRGDVLSAEDPASEGRLPIDGGSSASDLFATSRVYAAVRGTDRLVAVDQKRTFDGLQLVASTQLAQPVRYVAVDQNRIYAATDSRLVVYATNSFVGYPDGTFPRITTIDYRRLLAGHPALANAAPSGLTTGNGRVYLTFAGQPYLLSMAAPNV